ncbi:MAG: DMT family transporter [Kiloniellales bacterium]|nr:DMT family transporter [Kiloniellales bacterium]
MAEAVGRGRIKQTGLERLASVGLLLLMGTLWGGAIVLAKIATGHGGHPVGLALWQTTLGGSVLLVLCLVRRRPPPRAPAVLRFNFFCGAIGVALPAIALFWSARHLSAGVVAIAFASMPLLTYGLAALFKAERSEPLRILGVTLGLGAIVLLVLPETALPAAGLAPWVLLALGASVLMSGENLYIALRRPPGLDSLPLSCGRQLAAALLLAPFAIALDLTVPLVTAWGAVQWAASGMALASATAYTLFLHVIRTAGPVFASQTAYVITLSGVFWGMALLGERHSFYVWAALALMLLGLALVRPRESSA